ncbi:hypothetical protein [Photobacterium sp. J15]|nr:hypothetical protein [Photobacterium sp. J15]
MSQFDQNGQKTHFRHEEPEFNKLINTSLNRRRFLQAATAGNGQ